MFPSDTGLTAAHFPYHSSTHYSLRGRQERFQVLYAPIRRCVSLSHSLWIKTISSGTMRPCTTRPCTRRACTSSSSTMRPCTRRAFTGSSATALSKLGKSLHQGLNCVSSAQSVTSRHAHTKLTAQFCLSYSSWFKSMLSFNHALMSTSLSMREKSFRVMHTSSDLWAAYILSFWLRSELFCFTF